MFLRCIASEVSLEQMGHPAPAPSAVSPIAGPGHQVRIVLFARVLTRMFWKKNVENKPNDEICRVSERFLARHRNSHRYFQPFY